MNDDLSQDLPNAKREFKDTVFKDLFGSRSRRHYALSLYNALNGSSYDNPDNIEINTLEDVIYLSMKMTCRSSSIARWCFGSSRRR